MLRQAVNGHLQALVRAGEIGQAFADEVFGVFASAHPAVEIVPVT